MHRIVIDYETRSEADLRKTGGVKYAEHSSTEIMCFGYKINDEPAKLWRTIEDRTLPKDLLDFARDSKTLWIAHNALFEQSITEYVLRRDFPQFPKLPPERWKCTAAKAAANGLPRNLEGAALALDLPVKKNMDGRKLMLKYSKPRAAWKKWKESVKNPSMFGWYYGEPDKYFFKEEELGKLYDYCLTDVQAEYLLDKALPDLLPVEREIWLLNQHMNLRGVQVDADTARLVLKLIAGYSVKLEKELVEITEGEVTSANQRDRLLMWLNKKGLSIPDLAAKTVEDTLKALPDFDLKDSPAARVLSIRQMLAKSSTKKYKAILDRAGSDGRVRDLALYHGAHTGRESGTGLQLQNLPKGKIKNTDRAIEVLKTGDMEFIETLYGDPMGVFSSCVRGMITATPGFELFVADYNAIEARVLAWVANDFGALDVFKNGIDPYVRAAARIFKIEESEVTPEQRQIGKIAELGLGYGMGANKFMQTCINWGINDVDESLSKSAVETYRKLHAPITRLWSAVEKAAIHVVTNPKHIVKLDKLRFGMRGRFLWVELPSGRRINYHGPIVKLNRMPWGQERQALYHWGVNSLTKKWECASTYGGMLVENIVQGIARDINLHAALKLDGAGYTYLFQVHDELVSETSKGSVEEFEKILMTLPKWAEGLPITAKGWSGGRYKK